MKFADPTSPIRGLMVLLLALLLLYGWLRLATALLGVWTVIPLMIGLNVLVFQGATQPLWRGTRPHARQDLYRALVLVPCLLFHLFSPPFTLLAMMAQAMD